MDQKSLYCRQLFDGYQWHSEICLSYNSQSYEILKIEKYEGEKIQDETNIFAPMVIPALIDLQIYGAGGRLLSEFPDVETLQAIYEYSKTGGAHYFQPTIASQSRNVIMKAIDAVRQYLKEGGKGCIGLHLEGPWICSERRGAHSQDFVHAPSMQEVKELLEYGQGLITMITVAPEVCSEEILNYIKEQGIVISAGHTNATYEQATKAFNGTITTATHLFNAMSPLQHRAPGTVGAIFNHSKVKSSIVVDGYHVDFAAVQIAKKLLGERLFCITDAVTTTSSGPYQHELVEDRYLNQGVLSGSALTQLKCLQNLVRCASIPLDEAIRMCSLYPAQVMKEGKLVNEDTMTGTIEIGKRCLFLCLTDDLQIQ